MQKSTSSTITNISFKASKTFRKLKRFVVSNNIYDILFPLRNLFRNKENFELFYRKIDVYAQISILYSEYNIDHFSILENVIELCIYKVITSFANHYNYLVV